jgi:hypothetical protein
MVRAILRALAAATRRDPAGYSPIRTNNFFLFVALLIWGNLVSGLAPVSAYPFLTLLAVLLFFPISSDPLERVPRVRMGLWPLTGRARVFLRVAAFALNPVLWATGALLAWQGRNVVLPAAVVVGAAAVRARVPRAAPRFAIGRIVPSLPGWGGLLVTNHLRAMLTILDTWLAVAIAAIGVSWRIAGNAADPAAWPMLSILVGIALSTQAQCGPDLDAIRYRLLPAAAWQVLLARDAAYLAMQALLTVGLDPVAGLAFGMTALAAGRYAAIRAGPRTERWRFASGRVLFGALQMIAGAVLSFAGVRGTAVAVALWAASLWWGARCLETTFRGSARRQG